MHCLVLQILRTKHIAFSKVYEVRVFSWSIIKRTGQLYAKLFLLSVCTYYFTGWLEELLDEIAIRCQLQSRKSSRLTAINDSSSRTVLCSEFVEAAAC